MTKLFSDLKKRIGLALAWLDQKLLQPHPSIKDIALQKKSLLLSMFLLVFISIFAIVDFIYLLTVPGYAPPWYGYVFLVSSYALNRAGKYKLASALTISMFPVVVFSFLLNGSSADPIATLYYLVLSIILGSILLQKRVLILLALANSIGILLMVRYAPGLSASTNAIVGPLSTLLIGAALVLVSMFHRDQIEKSRQRELSLSEERLRLALDAANMGSWDWNIGTGDVKWSPSIEPLFGLEPGEFEGTFEAYLNLIHEDDRGAVQEEIERAVRGEIQNYEVVHRINCPDCSVRWLEGKGKVYFGTNGKPTRMSGTVTDITFRKQYESEREELISDLETINAEAETLRESAAAVALSLDLDETVERILDQLRRVVPYDSASIQIMDGKESEIIGYRGFPEGKDAIGFRFIIDENDPAYPILRDDLPYIFYPNVQLISEKFKGAFHEHIFTWMAIPLYARGRLIGFFTLDGFEVNKFTEAHAKFALTFANQVAITLENTRLYRELQLDLGERERLIEELESKNAELERFTYTVSHDLKSPLITINGFLGHLQDDIASGNADRIEHDSQRIYEAVEKMGQLLRELLELSRIGRLMNPPEPVPFESLAREAQVLVHGQLELRGVTSSLGPDLPVVYGDRQRLIEVLQNLIDNAVKFMGDQPKPHIEIGQRGEEGGKPIFYVKDNGIGISPEYHERIFGLFDKLDAKSDGTGIGLALVKRIVEFHGGRIWVESAASPQGEAGKGSTFCFTLPRSAE